jgi:thiol-disulfide isomerase/thioredoxin
MAERAVYAAARQGGIEMSSRRRHAVWFLIVAVAIGVAACSTDEPAAESLIGTAAPSLQGRDLTGAGITDLETLTGKPTAVVFWLNTCPHCQEGLPAIQTAWPDLEADANILTVGMSNPSVEGGPGFEDPDAFVASVGLTLPSIESTFEQANADWNVEEVPTIFVLDDELNIQDVLVGGDATPERLATSLQAVALNCCAPP